MKAWWVTEYATWKIFANTEEEAKKIWHAYAVEGTPAVELDMKLKYNDVESDWEEEQ